MPGVPHAYTDGSPAATTFNGRLYVAFKQAGEKQLRLICTPTPHDPETWMPVAIPDGFSVGGPGEVATDLGAGMTVHANRLMIAFTRSGIDHPEIGTFSMSAAGEWDGHGYLRLARTSNEPTLLGRLLLHRGDRADNSIRYSYLRVRPEENREIRGTRSNTGAAATRFSSDTLVAYVIGRTVTVIRYEFSHGRGWEWSPPQPIDGTSAAGRPALATHEDIAYLAYKESDGPGVRLFSHNGRSWIHHGALPRVETGRGPALVGFEQTLYLVYQEASTGQLTYEPLPRPILEPLTVMTLNVRIHPCFGRGRWSDPSPHHWGDRVDRIASMLMSYEGGRGPHLVAAQEVRRRRRRPQFDELLDHLAPAYDGIHRSRAGPWYRNPDEGMALFYRPDRLAVLEHDSHVVLPAERRTRGGCVVAWPWWPKSENRNFVWVRFRDLRSEQTFYVYNAHFGGIDCEKDGQARILGDHIASRTYASDPVILAGDFNTGYRQGDDDERPTVEQPFDTLLSRTGLEDAFRTVNPFRPGEHLSTGAGAGGTYKNIRRGRMIDFVLASPSFQVYDANIDRTMFNQREEPAAVPCFGVDVESGECIDCGALSGHHLQYSDHWAVWAQLLWDPA